MIGNIPVVIDRYRATPAAIGDNGDSVLYSFSDTAFITFAFLHARKLPLWAAAILLLALELAPLVVILDNLTLNIRNLLAPSKTVQAWQAGG